VPASASPLATPSVPLVQALLARSNLPLDSIALAVCILDSLDSKKFARMWRASCPLIAAAAATAVDVDVSLSACLPPSPTASPPATPALEEPARHHSRTPSQTHIDSVRPEVIIVAALVVANKFLEDPQDRADYYCRVWAGDMWSCPQLNATERCLLEALDYRILPLCDPDLLEDAKADMHFAAVYHEEEAEGDDGDDEDLEAEDDFGSASWPPHSVADDEDDEEDDDDWSAPRDLAQAPETDKADPARRDILDVLEGLYPSADDARLEVAGLGLRVAMALSDDDGDVVDGAADLGVFGEEAGDVDVVAVPCVA
jgi:hypothetical protein